MSPRPLVVLFIVSLGLSCLGATPGRAAGELLHRSEPCTLDTEVIALGADCAAGTIDGDVCVWLPTIEHLVRGELRDAELRLAEGFGLLEAEARQFVNNATFYMGWLFESLECPLAEQKEVVSSVFSRAMSTHWGKPDAFLFLILLTEVDPRVVAIVEARIDEANRAATRRVAEALVEVFRRSVGLDIVQQGLAQVPFSGRDAALFSTAAMPWDEGIAPIAPGLERLDRVLLASSEASNLSEKFRAIAAVVREMPSFRDRAFAWTRAGFGLSMLGRPIEAWTCLAWATVHFDALDHPLDPLTDQVRYLSTAQRALLAQALHMPFEALRLWQEAAPRSSLEIQLRDGAFAIAQAQTAEAIVSTFFVELTSDEERYFWPAFQVIMAGLANDRTLDMAVDAKPFHRQPLLNTAVVEDWQLYGLGKALETWKAFAYRKPHHVHMTWPALWMREAHANGDEATMLQALEALIAFVESQLDPLWADDIVRQVADQRSAPLFRAAVDLYTFLDRPDDAFRYAERGRAFVLRRLVGVPRPTQAVSSSELERSLEAGIVRAVHDGRDRTEAMRSFASARLERRLLGVESDVPAIEPPTSIDRLRRQLAGDDAILAFHPGNDRMRGWLVTDDRIDAAVMDWPLAEIQQVTDVAWRARWSALDPATCRSARQRGSELLPACPTRDVATDPSRDLFDRLIAPFADALPASGRLVVVPHGMLHRVPWAALRAPDGRRLADRYELVVAPSADVFVQLQEDRRRVMSTVTPSLVSTAEVSTASTALVLGDPKTHLAALPAARDEAEAVAAFLNVEPLLLGEATEAALRARASEATILHVAAHGVYERDHPLFSRLQLAAGDGHDGFLHVHEIWDSLDLPKARLVVLSACDTAAGEPTRGDDIIGLTQAFLVAGAPAVISTLWPVDDPASAQLMVSFYERFLKGATAGAALRDAQLALQADERYAAPYYWAGFVLVGDPSVRFTVAPGPRSDAVEIAESSTARAVTP
ncbi:MAG: CHAT domain-containing protein [Acidobacteriota bacterium]